MAVLQLSQWEVGEGFKGIGPHSHKLLQPNDSSNPQAFDRTFLTAFGLSDGFSFGNQCLCNGHGGVLADGLSLRLIQDAFRVKLCIGVKRVDA